MKWARNDRCVHLRKPEWGSGIVLDVYGDGNIKVSFSNYGIVELELKGREAMLQPPPCLHPSQLVDKYGIECLYHRTPVENIKSIQDHGGLWSFKKCQERQIKIPRMASNELSRVLDSNKGLHEYVHLSFFKYSPMFYRATMEGRVNDFTAIRINPRILCSSGVMFCDGVSVKNGVRIVPIGEIEATLGTERMSILSSILGSGTRSNAPQWAYNMEVLVPNHIPLAQMEF